MTPTLDCLAAVSPAPARCPPHRWYVPASFDEVVVATCLCGARQWQPTSGFRASLEEANKRNRSDGYPVIEHIKPAPLRAKQNRPTKQEEEPMVATVQVDEKQAAKIAENLKNNGQHEAAAVLEQHEKHEHASKYDHLLPGILEDLKTTSNYQVELKYNMPLQSMYSILNSWRRHGLIPPDFKTYTEKKKLTGKRSSKPRKQRPAEPRGAAEAVPPAPAPDNLAEKLSATAVPDDVLKNILDKLGAIDSQVEWLCARAVIDTEMKIDIVDALIKNTGTLDDRARAQKIIDVVEALGAVK